MKKEKDPMLPIMGLTLCSIISLSVTFSIISDLKDARNRISSLESQVQSLTQKP